MKRGEFAVSPAPPGARPALDGLSCRFAEIPATRGVIVSLLIVPAPGADPAAFRAEIEAVVAMVEASPEKSRPVPANRPHVALAARERRARGARWPRRQAIVVPTATARSCVHAFRLGDHALASARGRFRSDEIPGRGRRELRLPQVRRRLAHDPRLRHGARRRDSNRSSPPLRPPAPSATGCTGRMPR